MPVFGLFKRLVGSSDTGERRDDERLRAVLGARVLVVDDSATIRVVLAKMLMQDGYEVFKAEDGETAVEMAQTRPPDLIFLDIVLPGMSGFAVLRALRRDSRTRDIPIIMMSGNQQATEQFYVQRFGADGFVKKPFGRAEVFHAIRSLVQARRMRARVDAAVVAAIPDGMTAEEWNAIPDVAMPDEAHRQAEATPADVVVSDAVPASMEPADSAMLPPVQTEPSPPSTQAVSTPPPQTDGPAEVAKPAAPRSWSLLARSMSMRPTVSTGNSVPLEPLARPLTGYPRPAASPEQPAETDTAKVEQAPSERHDDNA